MYFILFIVNRMLFLFFEDELPPRKYAEVENARTASCKAPSDVVRGKAKAPKLDFCEKVLVLPLVCNIIAR